MFLNFYSNGTKNRITNASSNWVSLHFFYNNNLDSLLEQWLKPVVYQLSQEKKIEKYFFIRYWNGGPHIRLRFISEHPVEVKQLFIDEFYDYVKSLELAPVDIGEYENTSAMMSNIQDMYKGSLKEQYEEVESIYEPGTVSEYKYLYESVRYGGESARQCAEDHFYQSSQIVLSVIGVISQNPAVRFTVAIHFIAEFAKVCDLSLEDKIELFQNGSDVIKIIRPELKDGCITDLGLPGYEEQKSGLHDLALQLDGNSEVPSQSLSFNRLLSSWTVELSERWEQLKALLQEGSLPIRPEYIFMSYLHMFCNRLGLSLVEESYLYYLIGCCLADKIKNK